MLTLSCLLPLRQFVPFHPLATTLMFSCVYVCSRVHLCVRACAWCPSLQNPDPAVECVSLHHSWDAIISLSSSWPHQDFDAVSSGSSLTTLYIVSCELGTTEVTVQLHFDNNGAATLTALRSRIHVPCATTMSCQLAMPSTRVPLARLRTVCDAYVRATICG